MASNRTSSLPWRDEDELCSVRNQLFPGVRVGEPDKRDVACRTVGYSTMELAARD